VARNELQLHTPVRALKLGATVRWTVASARIEPLKELPLDGAAL
jgi:hypothetical protein